MQPGRSGQYITITCTEEEIEAANKLLAELWTIHPWMLTGSAPGPTQKRYAYLNYGSVRGAEDAEEWLRKKTAKAVK